jgi:hypothetical protein
MYKPTSCMQCMQCLAIHHISASWLCKSVQNIRTRDDVICTGSMHGLVNS